MANKPLHMDQIKRLLELKSEGCSIKKIARIMGLSKNTVRKYLRMASELSPQEENEVLEVEVVVNELSSQERRESELQEKLPKFIQELGRVGVTRYLLWQEYKLKHPDGFSYGRFCDRIRRYRLVHNATIRLDHQPGYYLQIDFTGKKMDWVDQATGEAISCEILVCTFPFSGYTFVHAVESQKQEDFIEALNLAFLYFGGLPAALLSDNMKSYVIKSDRYEPTFNELCIQFSTYYGVELDATRVYKPKDKANVERHVQLVYQRILAPLRDQIFFSRSQLNEAIRKQLDLHNDQMFQGKTYSRRDQFNQYEKPLLKELPKELFDLKKSTRAKVQRNYHVVLGEDKHQYSVPYQYIGKQTVINYTSKMVEIYIGLDRIAHHPRDRRHHGYSTYAAHMPEKHLKYLETRGWDADYFRKQADEVGVATRWAIDQILNSKQLIEQTYRACIGVLRLKTQYSAERLENACQRARTTHRATYGIINNILKNGMDKILGKQVELFHPPDHSNIRGPEYYQ